MSTKSAILILLGICFSLLIIGFIIEPETYHERENDFVKRAVYHKTNGKLDSITIDNTYKLTLNNEYWNMYFNQQVIASYRVRTLPSEKRALRQFFYETERNPIVLKDRWN